MNSGRLLINESPLMVMPSLAKAIGINEALILQQIHYWLNPDHNKNYYGNRYWVYNSYDDWLKQFKFMSKSTLRRAITNLESSKILLSQKKNINKSNHTKWYTIDYDKLDNFTEDVINQNPCNKNQAIENIDMSKINTSRNADMSKLSTSRCVQNEHIDVFKLNTSYIEQENTTENTKTISQGESQVGLRFKHDLIQLERIIDIWEKRIGDKVDDSKIPKSIKEKIIVMFAKEFKSDFDEWENYCKKISSSKFLMGEVTDFKLSIFDAFKEKFISKIFSNCYKIGDRKFLLTGEEENQELTKQIKDRNGNIPKGLIESLIEIYSDKSILDIDRVRFFHNHYCLSDDSRTLRVKVISSQKSVFEQHSNYLLDKFKKTTPSIESIKIYS